MSKKEQLRRRIIELIHGVPYEEAVEREFNEGCLLKVEGHLCTLIHRNYAGNYLTSWAVFGNGITRTIKKKQIDEVVGLPITLNRLIKAFTNANIGVLMKADYYTCTLTFMQGMETTNVNWMVTHPNGLDAWLDDQSEETQNALADLLLN